MYIYILAPPAPPRRGRSCTSRCTRPNAHNRVKGYTVLYSA